MKTKLLIGLLLILSMAAGADVISWTSGDMTTNTTGETSDAIPVSGWVDKIEIWGVEEAATGTVTVCSYASDTTLDTYATVTVEEVTPKVVRPRVVGKTSAGTALAGVSYAAVYTNYNGDTAVTTQLTDEYERMMAGSTIKIRAVGTVIVATNRYTVSIFFTPVQH